MGPLRPPRQEPLTDSDFNPPEGDGTGSPTIRQGPDGQYYELRDGRWQLLEGMPPDPSLMPPPVPTVPVRENAALDSWDRRARDPVGTHTTTTNVPLDDPRAGAAFGIDGETWQYVNALQAAGLITPSIASKMLGLDQFGGGSGGGGGGGSGDPYAGAKFAQQQAEFEYSKQIDARNFAYQQEQDRIAAAMANIEALSNQQQLQDQRRAQAQADRLAALPFVAPAGMEYFPGMEAGGYAAKMGLASPQKIASVAFNPDAALAPGAHDDQIAAEMARWSTMAGL